VKLVSYLHRGESAFGVLTEDSIIPASRLGPWRSVKDLLANDGVAALLDGAARLAPSLSLTEVMLLPVVPDPGKILCAGLNYQDHRDETGRDPTERPTIFIRFADSQVAAGASIVCPPRVTKLDYEGEVAVVIGRSGSEINPADAYDHVAGYACYNDFSARDWQRHSSQWTAGKNFPGTGAFGPYLVTPDEIVDVTELKLETRVNGEIRQSAVVADLIFDIPELIAYISSFTPLSPGDVIVTGTPGGVGLFRDPPVFLAPGDLIEVEVTALGILANRVAALDS
jgi:2-keto-4-pentenoate hydratase/2-oxohepta-3-ene-1,7-dioic acid hydratase in catechol pathway